MMMEPAGEISLTSDPNPVAIDETSATYVARWNELVSTTNWEKGRIISQWRAALIAAAASPQEYSDEAWSRRLQGVTPQHVGRLRRVWERFGQVHTDYDRLYWSHFQAALDWDDAELWLEGAVQNQWSISQMRSQRVAAVTAATGAPPVEDADAPAEFDSPAVDAADSLAEEALDDAFPESAGESPARESAESSAGPVSGEMDDLDDDGAADEAWSESDAGNAEQEFEPAAEMVRPFASLADLPGDLADAFESFKLAILRHKLAGWTEISREDVLRALDALKELVLAPSE